MKLFPLTIRFTVLSFFILATALVAMMAIGFQYHFSKQSAIENSTVAYEKSAALTREMLSNTDNSAAKTAVFLSKFLEFDENNQPVHRQAFDLITSFLEANPVFNAIYVGSDSGTFYEIINLDATENARDELSAAPADRWIRITIDDSKEAQRTKRTDYMDADGNIRHTELTETNYDPSKRPWYKKIHRGAVFKSSPYLFQSINSPGLTYSRAITGRNAVVGIDIALSSLSETLRNQEASNYGEIYIYDADGRIIASNQIDESEIQIKNIPALELNEAQQAFVEANPVIKVSNELDWPPFDFAVAGQPYGYSIDMLKVMSEMTGLEFEYVNGFTWNQLVTMFNSGEIDILQPVTSSFAKPSSAEMSSPFISAPYGVVTAENSGAVDNISELNGKRVAIPQGWSISDTVRELYPDITVVDVADVKAMLEAVSSGSVDAGIDNALSLNYSLNEFFFTNLKVNEPLDFLPNKVETGLHMVIDQEATPLIEIMNLAIAEFPANIQQQLKAKWQQTDTRSAKTLTTIPYPSLLKQGNTLNQVYYEEIDGIEHLIYLTPIGKSGDQFFAAVSPMPRLVAPAMDKVITSITYTILGLILLVPLCWVFSTPIINPIRELAENARLIGQRQYDNIADVESPVVEIQELSGSMNNMARSIQQYEESQKALLDSFIQLIAQAIDDKSPYTAGHCERVPQLALMLADYAAKDTTEPFKDFGFSSDEERREFRIAAWLHDCGKVTTPEHIVDKGSKLETIYNRIHEIRARFEILWRDAEIHYLKQLIDNPDRQEALLADLNDEHDRLSEEYEFVAKANVGGEFMSEEHVARLHEIASRTWLRHFDDQLGLSPLEETRYEAKPGSLPATEYLLADKPEHIIPRTGNSHNYDPSYGIKMEVPEHLYNLGELYNLSISRGTLTAEDRFKINEHVISTIKMLETLPLPDELSRVPRYASTHHETLKGTGYPRKLMAEDLSLLERIMVLSDIYEALTAADRPYKKAKPLSVAIDILYKMVQDDHVDVEIFKLFLRSGIYLDYARKFLSEEQIDEVDVDKYLRA